MLRFECDYGEGAAQPVMERVIDAISEATAKTRFLTTLSVLFGYYLQSMVMLSLC